MQLLRYSFAGWRVVQTGGFSDQGYDPLQGVFGVVTQLTQVDFLADATFLGIEF